ncbi:MAG: hypothetical protein M1816_002970 [Peltula sp. TS41687]|nr:MAG: hypothetical protein M1816_002970 [Peltula sp. TS41687]
MRVLLRPQLALRPHPILPSTHHHHHHHHPHPLPRRTLITPSLPDLRKLTTAEPQSLHAARTLSYPASSLYSIITDVDKYSHFLPYCTSSHVTTRSKPDPTTHRRWPHLATIQVGWAGYAETITSKIYCVPGAPEYTVEAIAGSAAKTIPDADLPHYADIPNPAADPAGGAAATAAAAAAEDTRLFKYLYSRWTIRPFPYKPPPAAAVKGDGQAEGGNPMHAEAEARPVEKSDVSLKLEFCFADPLYAAMSRAFAPRVAQVMVEAFEKRAGELLGREGDGGGQG